MTRRTGPTQAHLRVNRHLAPVLTAVMLGVLVSTLVAYYYTKRTVERLAQGQIIQSMNFLDREVSGHARELLTQSGIMAQEEVLRLSLEDSYLGHSARVAAQRRLEGYVSGGAFERAFLVGRDGWQALSADPKLRRRFNYSKREYFQKAMRGMASLATVPASLVTGEPIVVAATPLRDQDGHVNGMAAGVVSTAAFARETLRHLELGQRGGAYLLSDKGALLAKTGWTPRAGKDPGAELRELRQGSAEGVLHRHRVDGQTRLCLSRRNETTGWVLVVEVDEDEALSPARSVGLASGGIALLTLAVVLAALAALRRAMTSLRRSEEEQRTLTELSPVGIATFDAEGRIVYLNRQARTILGIGPDASAPEALILEDDAGAPLTGERSPIARVLSGQEALSGMQVWYPGAGADRKALLLNATRFGSGGRGVVATLEDVTERTRDLARLHESEQRFASLFRLSPDSIILSELDSGVIVDANDTFAKSHGYTRGEVLGKTVQQLDIYADDADRRSIVERVKREGQALGVEVRSENRLTGGEMHLSLSSLRLELSGKPYRLTVARDISQRISIERDLRENRRLLESILNTVPLAIFWKDADSVFRGCNATFANILGVSDAATIIGKTDFDMPMTRQECEDYRADDIEVMRSGVPKLRFVEPLTLRDGRTLQLETSKLPLLDDAGKPVGVLGIFQDITEHMRAMERLRQSEERFASLFRLSPEPTLLIDAQTRKISDANENFCALIGLPLEKIVGRDTVELRFYASEEARDTIYDIINHQARLDPFEFEALRADGSPFACKASAQTVLLGGRPYLLVMMRDISEAKKIREMMIQTEKMISVGGIAAGIAHEINNPLGIVLQAAQNLVQRTRPDFKKNLEVADEIGLDMELLATYMRRRKLDVFIEDIRSAAVRASAIIRHMLDFSRQSESRRKVCDLPAIIDKAIDLAGSDYDLKKSYDFRHIRIVRDYADDLPAINCTETEIEQVLLNLLRNAAQALSECDPLREEPRIEIHLSAQSDGVRIEISDNGPGIPAEVQRRVFEPFYTTKPPGVGTGLGLSVSYFIVTKGHHGSMRLSSRPGEGTTFIIELPMSGQGAAG